MSHTLEADYVVVGAGATALAFADTLLDETDASLIIVDRREAPGGHWNACYSFVRLHSPSLYYGVNSRELGEARIDTDGFNSGLYELAAGGDVRAYFHALMDERLLPSGRVCYLPSHEYADGVATNAGGDRVRLRARRKLVDATYTGTQLPNEKLPPFTIASGVRCLPPHALGDAKPDQGYVILGAGKTAMDTVVWLLSNGIAPERVAWVRPRDAWILPRETVQPSFDFFTQTFGALASEMEAARDATTLADLFHRLETAGLLARLDANIIPTMYRCAIASAGELALLRKVTNVIRMGRVRAIDPQRITLDEGVINVPPNAIFVNCTADGIPQQPPTPIFGNDRITLQYVRRCSPTFSAAVIAYIEATLADDESKNALCKPVPPPDEPADWARAHLIEAGNRRLWQRSPAIQAWLMNARLDRFASMLAQAMRGGDPEHGAILTRYAAAMKPGLTNLQALLEAA